MKSWAKKSSPSKWYDPELGQTRSMNSFQYPPHEIDVLPVETAFNTLYTPPPGLAQDWPPLQVQYLQTYLNEIKCQTVIVENHYIDRVFMHDDAVYYVRSLRSYPNFTKRCHFFKQQFDHAHWHEMIDQAGRGELSAIQQKLQAGYLGFSVIRPLPDSPIGRTVLPATSPCAPSETSLSFATIRCHNVHLAGFSLHVDGVPFQSQDQGVSACATTALWSALDCVAATEKITVSSPASITESATRYPLQEGRPFPNEGLTVRQICEATRAAGFSPLVIRGKSIADDKIQIFSYARSGFASVLALLPFEAGGAGHAVCCVGLREGLPMPQTDTTCMFREASSGLRGLYIHDDRLGPYAFASLSQQTDSQKKVHTCVSIEWPDAKPVDQWTLHAIVVPVPQKLRLTLSRLRKTGIYVAQVVGELLMDRQTTLDCHFELSYNYVKRIYEFDLSSDGLYRAVCCTVLSRYIGLIEIAGPTGPILDVVVDSTETNSESAVLACIKRSEFPDTKNMLFEAFAKHLGVVGIS